MNGGPSGREWHFGQTSAAGQRSIFALESEVMRRHLLEAAFRSCASQKPPATNKMIRKNAICNIIASVVGKPLR